MSAKYYTQFILTDAKYRGGNEFSGVIELSQPMDFNSDRRDIEAVLARQFRPEPRRRKARELVQAALNTSGVLTIPPDSPGFGRDFFCVSGRGPAPTMHGRFVRECAAL